MMEAKAKHVFVFLGRTEEYLHPFLSSKMLIKALVFIIVITVVRGELIKFCLALSQTLDLALLLAPEEIQIKDKKNQARKAFRHIDSHIYRMVMHHTENKTVLKDLKTTLTVLIKLAELSPRHQ